MATFAELMQFTSEQRNQKFYKMYKDLEEFRCDCSLRSFYNYCNGTSVPDIRTARSILNALDIQYTDKVLNETLESSIANRIVNSDENYVITTGISIPIRKLSSLEDDEMLIKEMLDLRVKETANNFSDYLSRLIREDLDNHILKERNNK